MGIRHKLSIKAQSSSLSPLTRGPQWPPHTPPSARHWRRGFDPRAHRQSRPFWRVRLGMLKHDFHLLKFIFSFCQHVLHLFSRQSCPASAAPKVDWVYLTLWYYAFDANFFFFFLRQAAEFRKTALMGMWSMDHVAKAFDETHLIFRLGSQSQIVIKALH